MSSSTYTSKSPPEGARVAEQQLPDEIMEQETSYDDVLYAGHSYITTHPNTLATIGSLMGMTPAPLTAPGGQPRVLDIGCASGENLIPMGEQLPDVEFVGIDLSARQIEQGREYVARTGVENVELLQRDLTEIGDEMGQFDYIMAHGIYSWVPAPVRDRLLEVCRERLAPNGIAYVSYNVYPGWHLFEIARHMMRFRTKDIDQPTERARAARQFIQDLAEVVRPEHGDFSSFSSTFRMFIHGYHHFIESTSMRQDSHILHDELETYNDPFYFHEFVEHCQQKGLQYVGDADFSSMMAFNLPKPGAEMLQNLARDRVEMEQYMDFMRNRSFRHTLLCHEDISLSQQIDMEALGDYFVASNAEIRNNRDLLGGEVEQFADNDGASIATDHPVSKVAFDLLSRNWPAFFKVKDVLRESYRQMVEHVRRAPSATEHSLPEIREDVDLKVLCANLLKAYATSDSLIRIFREQPPVTDTLSAYPSASAWARLQARKSELVTNTIHYRVKLDPFARFLLVRLDGTRSVDDLVKEVVDGPIHDGLWNVELEDGSAETVDGNTEISVVERGVADRLNFLLRSALLVA